MKRAHEGDGSAVDDAVSITALDRRQLLRALQHVRGGDFTVQLPVTWSGIDGEIAETFNEIVAANQRIAREMNRVGQVVGKEGRTRERVKFDSSKGAWGEIESSVNTLVDDLLRPTTEVTAAIASVAQGHLVQTMRSKAAGFDGHSVKPVDPIALAKLLYFDASSSV